MPSHQISALLDTGTRRNGSDLSILSTEEFKTRTGSEIAHLSYRRGTVAKEEKPWEAGRILDTISEGLARLAIRALPTRMDSETREALKNPGMVPDRATIPTLVSPPPHLFSVSQYRGGTVPISVATAGSTRPGQRHKR